MSEEQQQDQEQENEQTGQPITVSKVEDLEPMERENFYGRLLDSVLNQKYDYTEEDAQYFFAVHFGKDFSWNNLPQTIEDKRVQRVAQDVAKDLLDRIKLSSISLDEEDIGFATKTLHEIVSLNIDGNTVPQEMWKDFFMKRASKLPEVCEAYNVMTYGRRMFGWYSAGDISPEINSDVLKMEGFYRNGIIDREVLANYYYNVAMVYEKYAVQKMPTQTDTNERQQSMEYLEKALDKTDVNIDLLMKIKSIWVVKPKFDSQKILDAFHRVMDNTDEEYSLYLAHKLYAETLIQGKRINGLTSQKQKDIKKITEHYRIALRYTTSKDDKLDILYAIAQQQKNTDRKAYIGTQTEIIELLEGRKRIRALKKLERLIDNPKAKATILKSAINEFLELEDVRREDIPMLHGLSEKLRKLSTEEPKIIKKIDELQKRFKIKTPDEKEIYFPQMSSRGHDIFAGKDGR